MAQVYDARKIKVYIDGKEIKGFSPDSKVTITPAGEGSNRQVGTDGEVVFSIDVDNTFDIQLSLLQSSKSNDFLSNMYKNFRENGIMKRIMIKDLMGSTVFSSPQCCVQKYAESQFQKQAGSRNWTIMTDQADMNVGGANQQYDRVSSLNGDLFNVANTILY